MLKAGVMAAVSAFCIAIAATSFGHEICILEYDPSGAYKTGTPCTDARNAYNGINNNLFYTSCKKTSYKFAVVLQQDVPAQRLIGMESSFRYDFYMWDTPSCTVDPNGYYPAVMETGCPQGAPPTTNIASSAIDVSGSGHWPYQNVEFMIVDFSGFNYDHSHPPAATPTFSFNTDATTAADTEGMPIEDIRFVNLEVTCRDPEYVVKPPENVAITSQSLPGCTPEGGNAMVRISWTPPAGCMEISQGPREAECPSGCVPGVIVKKTSPGGEEVVVAKTTEGNIEDSTPRAIGVEYTYSVAGVCTGNDSATNSEPVSSGHTTECVTQPTAGPVIGSGWNMAGASRDNASFRPGDVFGSATGSYEVISLDGSFDVKTGNDTVNLASGDSIWIYSDAEKGTINAGGSDFATSSFEVSLAQGWNDFSLKFNDYVEWNDEHAELVCNAEKTALPDVFKYENSTYKKVSANASAYLAPWKGYWIKAPESCVLKISK